MSISGDGELTASVLLFPFPTSGHIIPLLDLANILLSRSFTVTILITPSNLPLLESLQSVHPPDSLRTLVLSFSEDSASSSPGLPARVRASSQLHGPILEWFQRHPSPPVAIISDFFLGWTQNLANHLGIPRIVFWPSGALASLILNQMWRNLANIVDVTDDNSLISFPHLPYSPAFPFWQVAEFPRRFLKGDPDWEFLKEVLLLNTRSWGAVFNSFTELEGVSIDAVKNEMGHNRVWAVGPLLPNTESAMGSCNRGGTSVVSHDQLLTWLHDKAPDSVVYVCFGSRSILTSQQAGILAAALERSGVHFIWRADDMIPAGYEDLVAKRGFILKGWVPQVEILRHAAVGAFLTHCGWNSLMEGIASGVLMLTWPLDADQFVNARLLVDELAVAIRACEGGPQAVPCPEKLAQTFIQSISSDQPKRDVVKKLSGVASRAAQSGGSSSRDMESLIKQLIKLSCK